MIDEEALQSIERLHKLKTDGIITDADFEAAKQKVLLGTSRPRTAPAKRTQQQSADLPEPDDHLNWAMRPLRLYADFTGRATRKEFWTFLMAYFLALLACGVFVAADEHGSLGALGTILMALILVATIVPSLAVQARRFHDQDLSGWLVLLNLIPYLGTIIVLICMTREGTHGGNQFGPDPLGREPLPGE